MSDSWLWMTAADLGRGLEAETIDVHDADPVAKRLSQMPEQLASKQPHQAATSATRPNVGSTGCCTRGQVHR